VQKNKDVCSNGAGSEPIIKQAEPHLEYKQVAHKVPTWTPKNTLWLFIISGEEGSDPPMTPHWNHHRSTSERSISKIID